MNKFFALFTHQSITREKLADAILPLVIVSVSLYILAFLASIVTKYFGLVYLSPYWYFINLAAVFALTLLITTTIGEAINGKNGLFVGVVFATMMLSSYKNFSGGIWFLYFGTIFMVNIATIFANYLTKKFTNLNDFSTSIAAIVVVSFLFFVGFILMLLLGGFVLAPINRLFGDSVIGAWVVDLFSIVANAIDHGGSLSRIFSFLKGTEKGMLYVDRLPVVVSIAVLFAAIVNKGLMSKRERTLTIINVILIVLSVFTTQSIALMYFLLKYTRATIITGIVAGVLNIIVGLFAYKINVQSIPVYILVITAIYVVEGVIAGFVFSKLAKK